MASEFIARNGIISNDNSRIIGALTANTFIKSGGTSDQYLMADGSISTLISINGITGSGTTNQLPKFNSVSGLSNSNFSDNGTTGQYASGSFVVQMNVGSNTIFRASRNQANTIWEMGNPDISQPFEMISSNYFGATLKSAGFLTLHAGPSYTEGIRIFSGGLLMFTQTPTAGIGTDFILTRNSSGNINQIPQSGLSATLWSGTTNFIPKFSGITLVNSIIQDNGTYVGIGIAPQSGYALFANGNIRTNNYAYLGVVVSSQVGVDTDISLLYGSGTITPRRDPSNNKFTTTVGTQNLFNLNIPFLPSGGNGTYNVLTVSHNINQQVGASGITRGLYIVPSITNAYDFRAIEVTTGKTLLKTVIVTDITANTFVKSGGTSSQYLMADGSISTLISTSGITGSGTTNFIPRFTSSGSVTTSDIYNAGSNLVGIGTTNPRNAGGYANLTIDGVPGSTLHLRVNNIDGGGLRYDAGGLAVRTVTGTPITFEINSVEKMRVHTDGNVGIGYSSPTTKLSFGGFVSSINGSVDTIALYESGNVKYGLSTNVNGFLDISANQSVGGVRMFAGSDNTTPTERFRLNANGNVLIGTTSDTGEKLQVNGSMISANHIINGQADGGNTYIHFKNAGNNVAIFGADSGIFGGSSADVTTYIYNNNKYFIATNGVKRLTVDSTGNVGLNTSSPSQKLHIQDGNIRLDYTNVNTEQGKILFRNASGAKTWSWRTGIPSITQEGFGITNETDTTYPFFIDNSGNIGIGTTNPSQKLEVNGGILVTNGNITNNHINYDFLKTFSFNAGGWARNLIRLDNTLMATTNGFNIGMLGSTTDYVYSYLGFGDYLSTNNIVLNKNGNVGIGTTNPLSKLHTRCGFNSDIYNIENSGAFLAGQDYGVAFGQMATGSFAPWMQALDSATNNPKNLLINPNGGSVGIGTTSPLAKTHITGSDSSFNALALDNTTTTESSTNLYMGYQIAGLGQYGSRIVSKGNPSISRLNDLMFQRHTGGADNLDASWTTDLMIARATGNILINTGSDTGDKLNVNGSIRTNSFIKLNAGLTNTSARPAVGASRIAGEIAGVSNSADASDDGFIRISAGGGTNASVKTFIDLTAYSTVGDMSQNITFGTSGSEKMRIDSTGNVGIGLTSIGAKLDVNGAIMTRDVFRAYGTSNSYTHYINPSVSEWSTGLDVSNNNYVIASSNGFGVPRVSITQGGFVGIGTSSPTSLLHVRNTSGDAEIKINTIAGTGSCFLNFQNDGLGNFYLIYERSANDFIFKLNAAERMRITASGNVLIGTTSDTGEKLQVNGVVKGISGTFNPTDTTGAFTIQSARASNTSNIQEWKNIAGTVTADIDGNGLLSLQRIVAQSTSNDALVGFSNDGSGLVAISNGAFAAGAVIQNTNGGNLAVFDSTTGSTVTIDNGANITAESFIKNGGTSSQFLMADGTVTEFKEYTAIFNTVGTSVSTVVLYNTIGSIVWSNVGTGRWQGVLSGAFPLDKCVFYANNGNGGLGIVNVFRLDNNTIRVQTYNLSGVAANDIINQGTLTVKVFP